MANNSNNLRNFIFTGSLVAGSLLAAGSASASPSNLFNFSDLGSGSQVRIALLEKQLEKNKSFEMKCGNKSTEAKKDKDAKIKETKTKEAKCGEGKCGEKKGADSTKAKMDAKMKDNKVNETKTKEAKCGEGKCGN